MAWPLPLALLNTGSRSEARMAMMAMTTSNSMSVNPPRTAHRKCEWSAVRLRS
jgi:hypothetical protein